MVRLPEHRAADSAPFAFRLLAPMWQPCRARNPRRWRRGCGDPLHRRSDLPNKRGTPNIFVSRAALDIEGLEAKQIDDYWQLGLIKSPQDIFTLRQRYQDNPPGIWRYGSGAKDKIGTLKDSAAGCSTPLMRAKPPILTGLFLRLAFAGRTRPVYWRAISARLRRWWKAVGKLQGDMWRALIWKRWMGWAQPCWTRLSAF